MQDEDEGDVRGPREDVVNQRRLPISQEQSSSSSSSSVSPSSYAQRYAPTSRHQMALDRLHLSRRSRMSSSIPTSPTQTPLSPQSPSTISPLSPLLPPSFSIDGDGGNVGRRRRQLDLHSLSDTDQPHSRNLHHRHFIGPESQMNPPSLPVRLRHRQPPLPLPPPPPPPSMLHVRPASTTTTLSMSSSPNRLSSTTQPPYTTELSVAVLRGFNGIEANAPSYHNQSFQLFPPDTRPPPRLFHTRSCPQGNGNSGYGQVHRQVSVPVAQREFQRSRPGVQRSISRTQTIKNYIRKSTATFFGVDGDSEENSRRRWADRRKRMASKNYGELKEGYEYSHQTGEFGDGYSSSATPATAASLGTPTFATTPSRSWPRQVSRVSDVDSVAATSSTAPVRLRTAAHLRRKDSVVRLTWNGIAYIASTVARRRQRSSVGQPPCCPQVHVSSQNFRFSGDDSVFEDSTDGYTPPSGLRLESPEIDSVMEEVFYDRITPSSPVSTRYLPTDYRISPPSSNFQQPYSLSSAPLSTDEEVSNGWRRSVPVPDVPEQDELSVGMRRMWKRITDQLFDNSDRRQYGMGVVGRYLKRSFRKDRITPEVKEQLDDMDDHRPFFTYWITTVQILITIISLAVYGFGPIGFEHTQRSGLVLVTSLSLQQIDYLEPDNFWIGPRAADLVHLGAKFAPCMRRDRNVLKAITTDRSQERNTACCIRNDNSGCVQTSRDECSTTISTWKKWHSKDTGPGGRISGSVCGQDPSYCSDPPSAPPYNWPDDITKWPICRKKVRNDLSRAAHEHMACEVIGHPCCIGILGECHITTREYCDFVKGFFHEEAALCSQVSCLDDICGMIPFYNPEVPDQFYRLWTSLFLHAGLVHLSVTVLVQYFFMRDLEKLTGAFRISLIYIISGVAGNLASAIFVPYRAEVGPAGSQFGLLACLTVEVLHSWQMLKRPGRALAKLLLIAAVLFVLGLLPWVDNYAHLFGFAFGFLLSYALLPFVSFGVYDRRKKVSLIWICLATVIGLFATLTVLFYVSPIYECQFCKYLTCLPLTPQFCASQDINITTRRYL